MKLRSKKGQLPFVELNGEEISDSSFIIKELSAKFEKDLDAALTGEQRTLSHAMISMVENHLHWWAEASGVDSRLLDWVPDSFKSLLNFQSSYDAEHSKET